MFAFNIDFLHGIMIYCNCLTIIFMQKGKWMNQDKMYLINKLFNDKKL